MLQAQSAEDAVEVVGGMKVLTSSTFEAGVAQGYTLVKMYAPWCGHCKRLAPVWEQLALAFEHNPDAAVAKVFLSGLTIIISFFCVRSSTPVP